MKDGQKSGLCGKIFEMIRAPEGAIGIETWFDIYNPDNINV